MASCAGAQQYDVRSRACGLGQRSTDRVVNDGHICYVPHNRVHGEAVQSSDELTRFGCSKHFEV